MEQNHTLRFLFVHGSTTTDPVGGLLVKNQQNYLRDAVILLQVISLCVAGQRRKSTFQPNTLNQGAQLRVPESQWRLTLYDGTYV
jgi:hypothetical protein